MNEIKTIESMHIIHFLEGTANSLIANGISKPVHISSLVILLGRLKHSVSYHVEYFPPYFYNKIEKNPGIS